MKPSEALGRFVERVVFARDSAPDEYQAWEELGYPYHRATLLEQWAAGEDSIKRDLDQTAQIDGQLPQDIATFDRGERKPGSTLMLRIYEFLT